MATLTRRGQSWVLTWSEGGSQHRKSLGPVSRDHANIQLQAKRYELASGQSLITRAPLFEDFAAEYLAWHAGEYPDSHFRIKSLFRNHLIPFFRGNALDRLEPKMGEIYKSDRSRAKANTVAKEVRSLQAMLNKAVEWKQIPENPLKALLPPKPRSSKPPHWYQREELERLYDSSKRAATWKLYVNMGLRRAEGLNLRKDWRVGDRVRVLSTEEARTKSGRWREVPLSPGARQAWDALAVTDSEYILPRMTLPSLSRAFAQDAERAGIGGSLHSLRHTFAAHLVQAGTPLRTVQVLMGHSTMKVTEQYAHLAPEYLSNTVSGLNL